MTNIMNTEELASACKLAKSGNAQAKDRVILSLQNLVYKIAHKYARSKAQFAELSQEGMLGVCIAMDRFDPERGVKFTTYAAWWIKARVLDYVLQNFSLVKIGTTQAQRKLFYRLRKLQAKLGDDTQAIADATDTTVKDVQEMQAIFANPVVSGDAVQSDNGGTLFDLLSGDDNPEHNAEDRIMQQWLQSTARSFRDARLCKPIELAVWDNRVAASNPLNLAELGDLLGVSRQRIDQVSHDLQRRFIKFARLH